MRERGTALAVTLGLAVAGLACSSGESKVVDQYFGALKANDQGTLTSFAMVAFDQKVDDWKIVAEGAEVVRVTEEIWRAAGEARRGTAAMEARR